MLSVDALSKLKNKRSSVKLTFSKCKVSAVPLTNGSTDNGLINGQRKLCPALKKTMVKNLRQVYLYEYFTLAGRGWGNEQLIVAALS
jgi:hypothetical protein